MGFFVIDMGIGGLSLDHIHWKILRKFCIYQAFYVSGIDIINHSEININFFISPEFD